MATTNTPIILTNHDIIFVGCRFGFNTPTTNSAAVMFKVNTGAYNIQFIYCTFAPLTSKALSAPGLAWPSSGAGLQGSTQIVGTNCILDTDAYQFSLGAYSTTVSGSFMVWSDHCDYWGFGNGALDTQVTTNQINFTENWAHDVCSFGTLGYHQDGVGYFDGGTGPTNVLIRHNTISANAANTNGIGFQTGPCTNIIIDNNYISGYANTVNLAGIGSSANSKFINNIFGTDVPWYRPFLGDYSAAFTGTTNLWRNNKLKFFPGSAPVSNWVGSSNQNFGASPFIYTSADDGKFLIPGSSNGNATLSTTDFTG